MSCFFGSLISSAQPFAGSSFKVPEYLPVTTIVFVATCRARTTGLGANDACSLTRPLGATVSAAPSSSVAGLPSDQLRSLIRAVRKQEGNSHLVHLADSVEDISVTPQPGVWP